MVGKEGEVQTSPPLFHGDIYIYIYIYIPHLTLSSFEEGTLPIPGCD